jgi:hypothetical protein
MVRVRPELLADVRSALQAYQLALKKLERQALAGIEKLRRR